MVMARAIMTAATIPSVPIPTICSNSQTKRKISARKKNTRRKDLLLLLAICSYTLCPKIQETRYRIRKFGSCPPNLVLQCLELDFNRFFGRRLFDLEILFFLEAKRIGDDDIRENILILF